MPLSEHLAHFGATRLWNVTHLENLKSILEQGILARNALPDGQTVRDISDQDAQSRRTKMRVHDSDLLVDPHDYVPLFIADNTPMLYVVSQSPEVILLEIQSAVADGDGVFFSDGNVASQYANLFPSPAGPGRSYRLAIPGASSSGSQAFYGLCHAAWVA